MARIGRASGGSRKKDRLDPEETRRRKTIDQGLAILREGRVEEAKALIHTVLAENMEHPHGLHAMGLIAQKLGQMEIAKELIKRAIAGNGKIGAFYSNLGKIYEDEEDEDASFDCYQKAARFSPDHAGVLSNYGHAQMQRGDLEGALKSYRRSLALDDSFPDSHSNVSVAYHRLGDLKSAEKHAARAAELNPENATANFILSQVRMINGDWEHAWEPYEFRFKNPGTTTFDGRFPQPRWTGEDLAGKRIILWGEQGIGDELRFISMAHEVSDICDDIAIECNQKLLPLFQRSFPKANVVPFRYLPGEKGMDGAAFQVPMGSLGAIYRTKAGDFPSDAGYLTVDPEKVQEFRNRLDSLGESPKVGISWRSAMIDIKRSFHYASVEELGPILEADGVTFVNLQYDRVDEDLDWIEKHLGVRVHNWSDIDLLNDLDSAAALTSCMDMVVSAATSVSSMAGALGVPTIEFRGRPFAKGILNARHDPWFPNHRIIEKWDKANWRSLFKSIGTQVEKLAAGEDPLDIRL